MVKNTPAFQKEPDHSPLKNPDDFPMARGRFVQKYDDQILSFEMKEIKDLNDPNIYFLGSSIKSRQKAFLNMTKNNQKAEAEVQKSLDDEEGYYNVILGDHLMYRYEVTKILGKGSFA